MSDWLPLFSGIIAALPGLLALLLNLRRAKAETAKVGNDDLRATNAQLVADNQRLRDNLRQFDTALQELRLEMAAMRKDHAAEIRAVRMEYEAEVVVLRNAISTLQEENVELQHGVAALSRQIELLGERPVYKPRPR